jgi:hypothetical protein
VKEAAIVAAIKAALTERGAWVVKTHGSPHLAGIPDLLVCYMGRFIALEVKRPETRGTVTRRQQHFLDEIEKAGGWSAVVTSVEEALDVIQWI